MDAPDKTWIGKPFSEIARERNQHPVDAFLDIVVDMDAQVSWKTTIGNHDAGTIEPGKRADITVINSDKLTDSVH
jgi:N-acyl-D-aspartate/D-glutamate deacylase